MENRNSSYNHKFSNNKDNRNSNKMTWVLQEVIGATKVNRTLM